MAHTNATLHFAQEITDTIIDFLHHDVRSLLACALVSRAWLPSSRFHLFRSCTIRSKRIEGAFRIITTTPDVATCIEQLTLVGERYSYHDFTVGALEVLLHALPRLRRLSLHNFMFGKTWAASFESLAHRDLGPSNIVTHPQGHRRRQAGHFVLEELQLLECDVITMANYADLYRLLSLFSSIQTLFLASHRTARRLFSKGLHLPPPEWALEPMCVEIQQLRTFDVPIPILENFLKNVGGTSPLRTFWYDDNVFDWAERSAVDRFGKMVTSLNSASHQHLQCLILGPLPIFENASWIEGGSSLARLQLASIAGLQTFHLRGRWLEPHLASVFSALPDSVREARFVSLGANEASGEEGRHKFREFALAFWGELSRRTRMTFVLDLGIPKRKLTEEAFGLLKDKAEKDLAMLALQGRLLIDDSLKER